MDKAEEFDPLSVPTLNSLLAELDAYVEPIDSEEGAKISDIDKTSLKPYVQIFEKHVKGLIKEQRVKRRAQETMNI